MLGSVRRFFAAAPHIGRLPADEVRRRYPRYRWRVMEATFLGYATFYLVRNNLAVVSKDIENSLHYDKTAIGSILAITAISYGLGKFLMGSLSDRSNPRKFMAFGLLLTALCNFAFGSVADFHVHLVLWALNGFFQGMGWPPCGRLMGHWYAERERGATFSIWNTSHNLGGGLAGVVAAWAVIHLGGPVEPGEPRAWQYAFYFPGFLALIGSAYLFWRLVDTPQSVGLPPIEEYRGAPGRNAGLPEPPERELTTKELFIDNVLTNKYVWILALANLFAYVSRYSMLDWGPMYLREVKHATLQQGGLAVLVNEFGGIPSTILLGWFSDYLGGRRGMIATVCMIPIMGAFTVILFTPAGYLALDMAMLAVIGCFIYPVINLIVIMALDLTSKKAIGTAAGFIGLFGYIGRSLQSQGFGRMLDHFSALYGKERAWEFVLFAILACSFIAMLLLALTWRIRPRTVMPTPRVGTAREERQQ